MGTLVVGCDGSQCAGAALESAVELARSLGDRLVVAYAAEPPVRSVGEEYSEHERALVEIGERVTGAAVTQARDAGVEVEAVIVHERPAAALLDLADERDARMIVIGSHGEGPIRGAILGSTPHKLLQHSGRPVLVVPAPDHEREGSDGR
jgi:nucleotide-binding universal stress UspA family protein